MTQRGWDAFKTWALCNFVAIYFAWIGVEMLRDVVRFIGGLLK